MYLVDANILVHATNGSSPHHDAARDWLDTATAAHSHTVGLPWASLLSFLRLVTNPRVFSPPAEPMTAWSRVEDWLTRPASWIPQPTPRHRQHLDAFVRDLAVSGDLVPDAHLAALAIEHGLTVVSNDSDFARFADVRWFNPVATEAR